MSTTIAAAAATTSDATPIATSAPAANAPAPVPAAPVSAPVTATAATATMTTVAIAAATAASQEQQEQQEQQENNIVAAAPAPATVVDEAALYAALVALQASVNGSVHDSAARHCQLERDSLQRTLAASSRSNRNLLEFAETGGDSQGKGGDEEESRVCPGEDDVWHSSSGGGAEPLPRLSQAALPALRVSGKLLVLERGGSCGGGMLRKKEREGWEEGKVEKAAAAGGATTSAKWTSGMPSDWRLDEKEVSTDCTFAT